MAFGTFLLRSFFISLPRGLEEAAMIDGCTRFQSFIHVILPLAKPGIMTLVIYDGITIWNEYLLANVLLRDAEKMTLPLGNPPPGSDRGAAAAHPAAVAGRSQRADRALSGRPAGAAGRALGAGGCAGCHPLGGRCMTEKRFHPFAVLHLLRKTILLYLIPLVQVLFARNWAALWAALVQDLVLFALLSAACWAVLHASDLFRACTRQINLIDDRKHVNYRVERKE